MADNNRTERRLLDSIRKAKTGPDTGAVDTTTAAGREAPPRGTGARKPAPRSRTTPATAAGSKAAPATARKTTAEPSGTTVQGTPRGGHYQRGERVWPD